MTYRFETEKLIAWFKNNRRELPWREERTPYAVWVSEIMLQQTQVAVVIPYFERWMLRFPSIEALARAAETEVMKMWEGLGYYSRARSLHQGAKDVVEKFGGCLPEDPAQLATIKGIGPYTTGAILSFAFRKKAAAVDGNVIRVLTRYFNIGDDVCKPKIQNNLRTIASELLPDESHWLFNEGLIELGATICQRAPKCSQCPLKGSCQSHLRGNAASLPYKGTRTQTELLFRAVAIIRCGSLYLIKRVEEGKVMSGLHEFPYFELTDDEEEFTSLVNRAFSLNATLSEWLPKETHSFTKYRATLFPALFEAHQAREINGYEWLPLSIIRTLPFSSGHRKILTRL